MKILLHICCAPCAIFPIKSLREQNMTVIGFFYKHNIHPFTECQKRLDTVNFYADQIDLKVIVQPGYDLEEFLRKVVYREKDRCMHCYYDRLKSTARLAKSSKFDCFSSSLLYSKFQKHDLIVSIAKNVEKEVGIPFYYQDFRQYWKEGIAESKRLNLYRQQYCGCIYSEKERYFKE